MSGSCFFRISTFFPLALKLYYFQPILDYGLLVTGDVGDAEVGRQRAISVG